MPLCTVGLGIVMVGASAGAVAPRVIKGMRLVRTDPIEDTKSGGPATIEASAEITRVTGRSPCARATELRPVTISVAWRPLPLGRVVCCGILAVPRVG